jgi:hypothetical protein
MVAIAILLRAANDEFAYEQEGSIPTRNHSAITHRAVIRVYDAAGNLIETHEHKGNFKEW